MKKFMALQDGFSITHPSFFDNNNFAYWKGMMEYYLMNDINNWIIIKVGFNLPRDSNGELANFGHQTSDIKKKSQANARATTLQCGLTQEQLNKVEPFSSAKSFGKSSLNFTKVQQIQKPLKGPLLSQLQIIQMKEGELHSKFKEILNRIHAIGEQVNNQDLIRLLLRFFSYDNFMSIYD